MDTSAVEACVASIQLKGDEIRTLKANKASKEILDDQVKQLLALKQQFQALTGEEWKPSKDNSSKPSKSPAQPQEKTEPESSVSVDDTQATDEVSKSELKKQKRKAEKAAKRDVHKSKPKQAKLENETPDTQSLTHVPIKTQAHVEGRLVLVCDRTSAHGACTIKCQRVAKACGTTLLVQFSDRNENHGYVCLPALVGLPQGKQFFGSNAVCRALAVVHGNILGVGHQLVEEWLDWEELVLTHYARVSPNLKMKEFRSTGVGAGVVHAEERYYKYEPFALVFECVCEEVHTQTQTPSTFEPSPEDRELYEFIQNCCCKVESALALTPYLCGAELTLADIAIATTYASSGLLGYFELTEFAHTRSWVTRILYDLPVEQAAMPEPSPVGNQTPNSMPVALPRLDLDPRVDGLLTCLRALLQYAIMVAFPECVEENLHEAAMARCSNPKFGDFQCNSPMNIAQKLAGKAGIPQGNIKEGGTFVAQKVIACLPPSDLIQETSIAGPGFINIRVSDDVLSSFLNGLLTVGPSPPSVTPLKVLVDFSSPNIAKEMHVGHLRSTIIGDTICKVMEFCGHDVLRVNHVGDWGTQFGMLIGYLMEGYPDLHESPPDISDLTKIYKAAKKRFDEDDEFKERARLNVVKLQAGDAQCRTIWELLCDISRREFQKVYDRLEVSLEEVGESFYNPMIPETIEILDSLGLITVKEGASCIFMPHFEYPLIVRKSDGGYGYDSTDMAAIRYRILTLERDWVVYITDAGQASHFQLCFAAARAAGWVTDAHRVDHIGFGVVCGDDGKRFKTRSGDTVRLVDLLDEAKVRMAEQLRGRIEENKTPLQPEEVDDAAAMIGYGAVKYFDLKQNPVTNYIFSYDRMLDTRGDTAVYLMFAHARLFSIIRKAEEERNVSLSDLIGNTVLTLSHPMERALAFEIMQFGDVVRGVLKDLSPNRLCEYLRDLATKFTEFVTQCKVLDSPEMHSRLLLCEATGRIMRKLFDLLGLRAPDKI